MSFLLVGRGVGSSSLLKHVANICYARATFKLNVTRGTGRGRGRATTDHPDPCIHIHISVSIMLIGMYSPSLSSLSLSLFLHPFRMFALCLCKISINAFAWLMPRPTAPCCLALLAIWCCVDFIWTWAQQQRQRLLCAIQIQCNVLLMCVWLRVCVWALPAKLFTCMRATLKARGLCNSFVWLPERECVFVCVCLYECACAL